MVHLSSKERSDYRLAVKLRNKNRIRTAETPFELSEMKEIESLRSQNAMSIVRFGQKIHNSRIFVLRMVREVKSKSTNSPLEKSRLVI